MRCPTIDWKVIKTLVFDLGNVLIPFEWQRGYRALAEHSPYSPEEIRLRIKEMAVFDPFERGQIEPRDLARRVSANLEMNIGFEKFREAVEQHLSPRDPGSRRHAVGLRARRRLLLLSNTDAIHFGWVTEKYPIMRHFDDFVVSFEVGFPQAGARDLPRDDRARGLPGSGDLLRRRQTGERQGALKAGIDAVQFGRWRNWNWT